jgi:hypothetical protein
LRDLGVADYGVQGLWVLLAYAPNVPGGMCGPDAPLAYGGPDTASTGFRGIRYAARNAGGCSVFLFRGLRGDSAIEHHRGTPRWPVPVPFLSVRS